MDSAELDGTDPAGAGDQAGIGATLVSARSFEEYLAMFGLSGAELPGRILDCPGGAADFVAEAARRGVEAVAVDPAYRTPHRDLAAHARTETRRGNGYLREHASRFVWTWFDGPDHHLALRLVAADRFAVDLETRPGSYLPAALPRLPFRDRSFELVLSSHLLFTYEDRLDFGFHLAAVTELARVSRGEVRLFPVLRQTDGERYTDLDRLRRRLAAAGLDSALRRVGYELQRGGDEMLVVHRPAEARVQP